MTGPGGEFQCSTSQLVDREVTELNCFGDRVVLEEHVGFRRNLALDEFQLAIVGVRYERRFSVHVPSLEPSGVQTQVLCHICSRLHHFRLVFLNKQSIAICRMAGIHHLHFSVSLFLQYVFLVGSYV